MDINLDVQILSYWIDRCAQSNWAQDSVWYKLELKKNYYSEQEEPSKGEVEETETEELADDPGAPQ